MVQSFYIGKADMKTVLTNIAIDGVCFNPLKNKGKINGRVTVQALDKKGAIC